MNFLTYFLGMGNGFLILAILFLWAIIWIERSEKKIDEARIKREKERFYFYRQLYGLKKSEKKIDEARIKEEENK